MGKPKSFKENKKLNCKAATKEKRSASNEFKETTNGEPEEKCFQRIQGNNEWGTAYRSRKAATKEKRSASNEFKKTTVRARHQISVAIRPLPACQAGEGG